MQNIFAKDLIAIHMRAKDTQDRFLKSRGVIRGRYAYADRDRTPNTWGYDPQWFQMFISVVNHVS